MSYNDHLQTHVKQTLVLGAPHMTPKCAFPNIPDIECLLTKLRHSTNSPTSSLQLAVHMLISYFLLYQEFP